MSKIINILKQNKNLAPIIFIIAIFLFLSIPHLSDSFIHFNEDNDALYGNAAANWVHFGIFKLKFGMVGNYLNSLPEKLSFYTHHPSFFILPTYLLYQIFGINELTTRLAPLIFALFTIVIFFFLIFEITKNRMLAVLSAFFLATFPALTFYGKMLDQEIFILFFAILSFYLFIKLKETDQKIYFWLLLISLFFGNLCGWHFYFIPLIIWFLSLINKNFYHKKLLLFLIPLIVLFSLALIFSHLYLLGGTEAFKDLFSAFGMRSQMIPLNFWFKRLWVILKINFPALIVVLGFGWLIYSLIKYFKEKQLNWTVILFLHPFLITIIFKQWVTHPYGPFYFTPFFAFAFAQFVYFLFEKLKRNKKNEEVAYLVLFGLIMLQFYWAINGLKFFDKNLVLNQSTIEFLKNIRNQIKSSDLCLGQNATGIGYGAIFSFYLQKPLASSPDCIEKNVPQAIIFNPQLGDFYLNETKKFENAGYKPLSCGGLICLMEK